MLMLLSPAKSLDYDSPHPRVSATSPLFTEKSAVLVELVRQMNPSQIAQFMEVSEALAQLNTARFMAWSSTATPQNARSAIFAFNGDVYDGLNAQTLSGAQITWLQSHLCILSGLYGVLRPLDFMQPYRLEMGRRLANPLGATLYDFWRETIVNYLNEHLKNSQSDWILNLASQEYFKAVDQKRLKAPVVDCVFEEKRGDVFKIISFNAKKARGLMARFCAIKEISTPRQLHAFNEAGYAFSQENSSETRFVFRRTP